MDEQLRYLPLLELGLGVGRQKNREVLGELVGFERQRVGGDAFSRGHELVHLSLDVPLCEGLVDHVSPLRRILQR